MRLEYFGFVFLFAFIALAACFLVAKLFVVLKKRIFRSFSRSKRFKKHVESLNALGLVPKLSNFEELNVEEMNDTVLIALTPKNNLCLQRRSGITERVKQVILSDASLASSEQAAFNLFDKLKLVDDIFSLNSFDIYPLSLNEDERYIRRLMIRVNAEMDMALYQQSAYALKVYRSDPDLESGSRYCEPNLPYTETETEMDISPPEFHTLNFAPPSYEECIQGNVNYCPLPSN